MRNVKARKATDQVEQGVSIHHDNSSSNRLSCHLADPAASSWVLMHTDLLDLIASRVLANDLLDYVRFRAVCLPWRKETSCPRGRGVVNPSFHPRQWMMFPEGGGLQPGHPALNGYVRLFNISTGTFVRVHLPCFKNHCVLDCPDGLLLLRRNKDDAICLLHPFTGDFVLFPPLFSIQPQVAVFAAVSVNPGGTVTIMVAISRLNCVAYASTGDWQWTRTSWTVPFLHSAVPFRGSIYVVDRGWDLKPSHILRIDPPDDTSSSSWLLLQPKTVITCPAEQLSMPNLVECNSELLLVGYADGCSRVVVLRVADLLRGIPPMPLTSIGDQALFVGGWNMAVNSKNLPSVQGNSIVFTNGGCMGRGTLPQYDLGSGTWSQLFDGDFLDGPMPRPYSLVLHVATCCQRLLWNKGQILCLKRYGR